MFHNPDEENGYLSNWALSKFTVNGLSFSSMEQYMMYQKAVCFKDEEIAEKILATTDVAVIKALGRQVKGYNDSYWNGVRQLLVYEGLKEKFAQNDDLKSSCWIRRTVFWQNVRLMTGYGASVCQ